MQQKLDQIINLLEILIENMPKKYQRTRLLDGYKFTNDSIEVENRLIDTKQHYTADELQDLYRDLNLSKVSLNKLLSRKKIIKTGHKKNNQRLNINLNYKLKTVRF